MEKHDASIDIWVPGPWAGRDEVVHALSEAGFVASGIHLSAPALKCKPVFNVLDHHYTLAVWMDVGSGGAFERDALEEIAAHKSIVSLAFEKPGAGIAQAMLAFTDALKRAGGFGVRLDRCGLSHPWERWQALLRDPGEEALYRALVVQVADEERGWVSSFGMNQFGLADAAYDGDDYESPQAAQTVFAFNGYIGIERPQLKDGDTFAYDEEAPVVQMSLEGDDRYAATDPYYNAHGIWVLTPVSEE